MKRQLMEVWKDEYFQTFGTKYKNHVSKFVSYLKNIGKADAPDWIGLSDIVNSIGYYRELGKIKSRGSMMSHLESIKSFYDYLLEKGKTHDIFTQMNYECFQNDLVTKYNLSEKVVRQGFMMETIRSILVNLDNYLSVDYQSIVDYRNKERYCQRILLRLFIKLTLIAPTKRQIICNLQLKDFDSGFKNVKINNVIVRVPNGLTRDILHAIQFAQKRGQREYNLEDNLFDYISISKFSDEYLNTWFYYFLKEYAICAVPEDKTSYPIEPIMITAINDMVRRMFSPALIAKINGSKIGSIEQKYYKDGLDLINIEMSIHDAINWEIAKSEYYTYI